MMRFRLRTMALAGALALGGLVIAGPSAHAQCGGGFGRAWGGYYGGGGYYCGSYCGLGMGCMGMGMGGMPMGGMTMGGVVASPQAMGQAPAAPAAGATSAAPQPAAASYYCPMHPGVMSTFPANCPYCGMALKKR